MEVKIELFTNGGYFEMPHPAIRPGLFILRIPGQGDLPIRVNATSHQAAYFEFCVE